MDDAREAELIRVLDDHKAHLMALQCLANSIMRALPVNVQADVLREWDTETEAAKTMFLNSKAPDGLLHAFDQHVKNWNDLRA